MHPLAALTWLLARNIEISCAFEVIYSDTGHLETRPVEVLRGYVLYATIIMYVHARRYKLSMLL